MVMKAFPRFGRQRPQVDGDPLDLKVDIFPWMDSVDLSAAKLSSLGFRNQFRNGDIGVRQRGNGPFTGSNAYTADGWVKNSTGGTHSITLADLLPGDVGSRGYLQSVVASQAAVADFAYITQRIESVRTLAGQQVTLSFMASAAAGIKVGIEALQFFGTGGTPSADVITTVSAITLAAAGARYTVTFTIPSIAGKTLGTSGTDSLWLLVWLSSGATNAARASNIGIQNATINLWDLQLEAGPDASPFERLPSQQQLAWCQRYFWRQSRPTVGGSFGSGQAYATNSSTIHLQTLVQMRAIPTITPSAVGHFSCQTATGAGALVSALGGASQQIDGALAGVTHAATLAAGNATILFASTAGAFLDWTAEL